MCFSLAAIGSWAIWAIIVIAAIAVARVLLPWILGKLSPDAAGLLSQIFSIVLWAVGGIVVVLFIVWLFSCLLNAVPMGIHR